MEKEIDVITLCKKITELTNHEKCSWKETSENNRFRLILNNGSIEVLYYEPGEMEIFNPEYYNVALFDDKGERYASYRASNKLDESYTVFADLYKSITSLLEKKKRRKMALLFEELNESEDK